jgi:hypothetical protein
MVFGSICITISNKKILIYVVSYALKWERLVDENRPENRGDI